MSRVSGSTVTIVALLAAVVAPSWVLAQASTTDPPFAMQSSNGDKRRSSRKAEAMTFGVNWYLNPFIKYVVNVERTVFDDDADGPRPVEHALVFRAQLQF